MADSRKNRKYSIVDPRTGEVISEAEIRAAYEPIIDGKGGGRGRLFGAVARSSIQQQLRMKSAIGSSNYCIEAYFRERQNAYKNLASKKPFVPKCTQPKETPPSIPPEPVKRVKATRTKSNTNALMTHLLAKINLETEEGNVSQDEKINSNNNHHDDVKSKSTTSNTAGSSTVSCK